MTRPASPLRGQRVLVTRQPEQARSLVDGLAALGATVTAVPLTETLPPEDPAPLADALRRIAGFDWVAFTSARAVRAVHQYIDNLGIGLGTTRVASVGRVTSASCASLLGRTPDLEPVSDFRAAGLVRAFADRGGPPGRVLLPVSSRGRAELEEGLRRLGYDVERVVAYRTEASPETAGRVGEAVRSGLDLVVLASPSAVEAYLEAAGEAGRGVPAAVMGPTTAEAAAAAGLEVRAVAVPSTVEGLLQVLSGQSLGDDQRP